MLAAPVARPRTEGPTSAAAAAGTGFVSCAAFRHPGEERVVVSFMSVQYVKGFRTINVTLLQVPELALSRDEVIQIR